MVQQIISRIFMKKYRYLHWCSSSPFSYWLYGIFCNKFIFTLYGLKGPFVTWIVFSVKTVRWSWNSSGPNKKKRPEILYGKNHVKNTLFCLHFLFLTERKNLSLRCLLLCNILVGNVPDFRDKASDSKWNCNKNPEQIAIRNQFDKYQ